MITDNKRKIEEKLNRIADEYVEDILNFLNVLQAEIIKHHRNTSSLLLSEKSLAKDWLSKEEEDAWPHL